MSFCKQKSYRFLILIFFCSHLYYAKTVKVLEIFLSGDITNPNNEISGMDWYRDYLYLIPENLNNFIYVIPKFDIDNYVLSKNPLPIVPKKVDFTTPNYKSIINGFDGFEAIAFHNESVFLAIEAKENNNMKGFISWGTYNSLNHEIFIPEKNLIEVETPIQIDNMSYESILISRNNLIMLYEANGINLQKIPKHKKLSTIDFSISTISSINIEYRITDATKIDSNGKFWCINYLWPGDIVKLKSHEKIYLDDIRENNELKQVERILEFELKNEKILLTNSEPVNFQLESNISRNWEGIVRYDKNSFLIVTDKYPRMILGLVKND